MPTGHDMHAPVSLLAVAASLAYFPAEHKIAPEEVADGLVDPDIDGVFVDEPDELAVGLDDGVFVDEPDELVVGLDDRVGTALSGSVADGVGEVDTVNDDLALDEDVTVGLVVADVELDDVAVDEAVDDEETVTDVVGVGVTDPELVTLGDTELECEGFELDEVVTVTEGVGDTDGVLDPDGLDVTVALIDGVVDTVVVPLVVGLDDRVGTALSGSVDEGVGDVDTVNDDLALDEDVIVGLVVADVELDEVAVDEAVEETVTDVVGVGELHTVSDVVVHVVETMPFPGLEPQVEQVRHEV